jgi:hypothetical protein
MHPFAASLCLLMVLLLSLAGCSGGMADLEGTVSCQRKVVASGSVIVVGKDGGTHSGSIGADGAYRVTGIPIGSVKIAVSSTDPKKTQTRARKKGEASTKQTDSAGWFALPSIYSDLATSPLKTEVKSGANRWDIELR